MTAPLPPAMVTVGDKENTNIITIGWTGILATHPPRTYISVRPERYSYEILKKTGEFVINLPSVNLARAVDFAGMYTGRKVDKFKKMGLTKIESGSVSTPSIAECPISLECKVYEVVPMGTHDVFFADIVGASCDEGIVDKDGRICYDRASLLAYAHGEYFALGEKLGKFGFSATRKETCEAPKEKKDNKKEPFYKDFVKKAKKGGRRK